MKERPKAGVSSRRDFILGGASLAAAGMATFSPARAFAAEEVGGSLIKPGDTVLFQGDSITDAGRKRDVREAANNYEAFGSGYAWLAASQMLVSRPDLNLQCLNRGISGNKVFQLAERWQEDCLDINPNVLCILIGVNDIWHKLLGRYDGTVKKYETDYRAIIARTRKALPDVKLVICEPFVLRCGAVNDRWFPEFDDYRHAARNVAENAGGIFLAFHEMFERAVEFAPPEHWAKDGVHPSPFGAALMAHAWLKAVGV